MEPSIRKLPNNLRVISVPMPTMESVTVTIWVGVGSRFETNKISGISHFLEHMVFKGSKKRPSAKEIAEAIDSIGGEFNASTSKEWTNFYIKTRKGNLDLAFDVLSDMVLNPLLKEKDIEREKGVVVEEIGMYEDTPMWKISDYFENLIFKGSELEKDIIGTRKSVKGLKQSDFDLYRKRYYGSNNIVVTVSGGITNKEVSKLSEKYLGSLQKTEKPKVTKFSPEKNKSEVLLSTQKREQAHFILGFLAGKRGSKDRFAEEVLSTILGKGMSSRLFTEVREKRGLAYSVKASREVYNETGYFEVYAGVDPKRIDEAIKVTLEQCNLLANKDLPISAKELKKAKEFLKGHIALGLEDTKAINSFFGVKELLLGKTETPKQVFELIDKVTIDEVVASAGRIFGSNKAKLAVIGPYDKKERFENLIK